MEKSWVLVGSWGGNFGGEIIFCPATGEIQYRVTRDWDHAYDKGPDPSWRNCTDAEYAAYCRIVDKIRRIELLKSVRLKYGLTQAELGELLGYKTSAQVHVSRMETGAIKINLRTNILLWYILNFGPMPKSVLDNLNKLLY